MNTGWVGKREKDPRTGNRSAQADRPPAIHVEVRFRSRNEDQRSPQKKERGPETQGKVHDIHRWGIDSMMKYPGGYRRHESEACVCGENTKDAYGIWGVRITQRHTLIVIGDEVMIEGRSRGGCVVDS